MGVMTIIRRAKCKDCEYIRAIYNGKKKSYYCNKSVRMGTIYKSDAVCSDWKLRYS
jgi:hypothetical protein